MSTIPYRAVDQVTYQLETRPGAEGVNPVHALPTAVETAITTMAASLATIATYLDQLEGYTDGLETLITTTNTLVTSLAGNVDQLEGYTDGLEALITTLSGHVDQLEGYTDGIETLITSSNTKLDSIVTALTPGTPVIEQKTGIGTGADVQFTTAALRQGGSVQNESTGGQLIYLTVAAVPTATICRILAPGQSSGFIPAANTNVFYMRSSASGGAASFAGG